MSRSNPMSLMSSEGSFGDPQRAVNYASPGCGATNRAPARFLWRAAAVELVWPGDVTVGANGAHYGHRQ